MDLEKVKEAFKKNGIYGLWDIGTNLDEISYKTLIEIVPLPKDYGEAINHLRFYENFCKALIKENSSFDQSTVNLAEDISSALNKSDIYNPSYVTKRNRKDEGKTRKMLRIRLEKTEKELQRIIRKYHSNA
jgi:hypothetical protein